VQQAADALQATDKPAAPKGVLRVQVEEGFRASSFVWSSSIGLMSAANQVVMVVLLTYFMLLSDQLFKRKLVEMVGTLSQKKTTVLVLEDIAGQIERFIKIQLLTSTAVALLTWGALWALGLEQAALWGLLAGVFNSIPYYGPPSRDGGAVDRGVPAIRCDIDDRSYRRRLAAHHHARGIFLTPLLHRTRIIDESGCRVRGLLFWSWVWGVWGILLAVPMMMVIKVICDHVEPLQPVGHLLGD
jgi:predicted PurR-regulated permease PerM